MAKVYLSSTRLDLEKERAAVKEALGKAHLQVIESYRAADDSADITCLNDIDACDFYVGVFAWRYGFQPPGQPKSITELEYEHASRVRRIPCLIFILDRSALWPPAFLDPGHTDPASPINQLIARLSTAHTADYFTGPDDLAKNVVIAVNGALQKRQAAARDELPPMAPGARFAHPRALDCALLLLAVRGIDDAFAGALLQALQDKALESRWRSRLLEFDPATGIDPVLLDRELSRCRAVALLVSQPSLQLMAPHADAIAFDLAAVRTLTGHAAVITQGVDPAALPADWAFDSRHALGQWVATGTAVYGGELAAMLSALGQRHPDIDHRGLVGLQFVVVAMTRAEAQALKDDPSQMKEEPRKYFARNTAALEAAGVDWLSRYGTARSDWAPYATGSESPRSRRTAAALVREIVDEINSQREVSKRDQENLRGHQIRVRAYPFDPLLDENDDPVWAAYRQMLSRRCLVLVDELSLCHPKLRQVLNRYLTADASVVTLAPLDPAPVPLEQATEVDGFLSVDSLVPRFSSNLDPRCELTVGGRWRLKRWLRYAVPETLAGAEEAGADPDKRAAVRAQGIPD